MNYLDVYFSRVNHFGETSAERIKNSGIVAFEKWKAQSPFTVIDLSVERGLYFSGIIQTNKDKAEEKIMFLYVALDIPIKVGDILTWRQDNGDVEKWLLLQKEHKVHEQYQTFQIIKCNYNLKWLDTEGYLHRSWAYAVSSVDAKVKGNFRMWHSLISPQPNKFAEIIMPRPKLKKGPDLEQLMRGITFIIEDEGWIIIECDWTSVEGVVYMSLTESKVNYQYDDVDIEVADADRYKFPELPILYTTSQVIIPTFEEGTLNQWEIELRPSDFSLVNENPESEGEEPKWFEELHPSGVTGTCVVTMRLKNRPAVTKDVEIQIYSENEEEVYLIDGPDTLYLDRQACYSLVTKDQQGNIKNSPSPIEIKIVQSPNTKEKGTITQALDDANNLIENKFILHANNKNEIGDLILVAVLNNESQQELATKTVKIIPLW